MHCSFSHTFLRFSVRLSPPPMQQIYLCHCFSLAPLTAPSRLWLLEVCTSAEIDRQLIESGVALAQGLLTAHKLPSDKASLCTQREKTMHIRRLSLSRTRVHVYSPNGTHSHTVSHHISITSREVARKMSCSVYRQIVLKWENVHVRGGVSSWHNSHPLSENKHGGSVCSNLAQS